MYDYFYVQSFSFTDVFFLHLGQKYVGVGDADDSSSRDPGFGLSKICVYQRSCNYDQLVGYELTLTRLIPRSPFPVKGQRIVPTEVARNLYGRPSHFHGTGQTGGKLAEKLLLIRRR